MKSQQLGIGQSHGGEKFQESTLITDEVIAGIEAVSHLAPLHNPHNLTGIMVCAELMPDKPQAAVFDTVFSPNDASARACMPYPTTITKTTDQKIWVPRYFP